MIARDDEAAAFARNHGADPLADIPRFFAAARGVVAMDAVAFDINVVKHAPPPDRAFAPLAVEVSDGLDGGHETILKEAGNNHQGKSSIPSFSHGRKSGRNVGSGYDFTIENARLAGAFAGSPLSADLRAMQGEFDGGWRTVQSL